MVQRLGTGKAIEAAPAKDDTIAFDTFTLDLAGRALHQNGHRLHVRRRELDILIYLAQRPNQFVPREELIDSIWLGQPVSDANVRVQISALRRLLGEGADRPAFIDFVQRQGYRFRPSGPRPSAPLLAAPQPSPSASEVTGGDGPKAPPPFRFDAAPHRHNLPVRVKRHFGRERDCDRLVVLLVENRTATIVGPGGIGKTTLALTAAERLVDTFDDGVRFVDLAGLTDGTLVAGTLAATIGVALGPEAAEDTLIDTLASRRMLFVVDNCEHLVGPVASLVESILTQTRHTHFLCTSREPLRIDSECVLRLGPLELPPQARGVPPQQMAAYPSVQLFNDRARQGGDGFDPDEAQIPIVAGLCRRLDGNPLAIELAAARLSLFGLDGLVAQLDESLDLLVQGRRTAMPRHKTLRETIDWSYGLLPPEERRLLNRLSIFRGRFSLDAARAMAGADMGEADLVHSLAELVAKSLIDVDRTSNVPHYRILLLTREFAMEKLAESGELDRIARRHANFFFELVLSMGAYASVDTHAEAWVADIGAAIDWGLGEPGDPEVACNLMRASFGVLMRFSRLPDRRRLVQRAIERTGDAPDTETVWKLGVYTQMLHIAQFTSADETELKRHVAATVDLAERVCRRTNDLVARCELAATRCFMAFNRGDAPKLLRHASEGAAVAMNFVTTDARRLIFERFLFQAHHFCGHHDEAATYMADVQARLGNGIRQRVLTASDHVNPAITMRIFEARAHWIRGEPARASDIAAEALDLALTSAPSTAGYVLGFATIPIALWRGDDAAARDAVRQMESAAIDQGMGYWLGWAHLYAFVLDARAAGPSPDSPVALPPALVYNAHHTDHLATLCLSENREALERVEVGRIGWNAPEVLRRRAEWLLATGAGPAADAEALFVRALDLARRQKAPAWELRAALSLGRFRQTQGRTGEALGELRAAIRPFDPTLRDHDIVAAHRFVRELESA